MCNKYTKRRLVEINNYWLEEFYWLEIDYPTCFICGMDKHLQQCHLVPKALGGTTDNDNIVLLCEGCHSKAPNINIKDIMLNWIHEEADKYEKVFHMKYEAISLRLEYVVKIYERILQSIRSIDIVNSIMDFIQYKFLQNTIYTPGFQVANETTTIEYYKYLSEYDDLIKDFTTWYFNINN